MACMYERSTRFLFIIESRMKYIDIRYSQHLKSIVENMKTYEGTVLIIH